MEFCSAKGKYCKSNSSLYPVKTIIIFSGFPDNVLQLCSAIGLGNFILSEVSNVIKYHKTFKSHF